MLYFESSPRQIKAALFSGSAGRHSGADKPQV
jgi:hypothetical protein